MTPEHVVILSDTLSIAGDTKLPRSLMTKIYAAPHIGAVITGTGIGHFVTQFFLSVNERMVVTDVDHLSEFAPDTLRGMWSAVADQLPGEATTTIYTFGISAAENQFAGFAYRSTNNFEAEPLQHGTAAKPAPTMEQLAAVGSLSDFAALAFLQQATDRSLPRRQRVGIGGELWLYILGKAEDGSLTININRATRMPHYDDDFELLLASLPENAGHPRSVAALMREMADD